MLINSGATYNFMVKKIVKELQLLVKVAKFAIILGDNKKVYGVGKCQGLMLIVQ